MSAIMMSRISAGARKAAGEPKRGELVISLRKLYSGGNFILEPTIKPDKLRSILLRKQLKRWEFLRNHLMTIFFKSGSATDTASISMNTIMKK